MVNVKFLFTFELEKSAPSCDRALFTFKDYRMLSVSGTLSHNQYGKIKGKYAKQPY